MKLLIPVQAGLESVVKRQLAKIGYPKAPAENGRIAVDGSWQDVARLNVFLRSGERVLICVGEFVATTFDELYDGFYAVEWERYLETDAKILMDGKSYQSALAAVKAMGGVAKKAIIRRLADKKRSGRATFPETGARTIVGFSVYRDKVTVTIDTSGDGLHKRGYRSLAYSAPLKETLAAALIDLSFYHPEAQMEKPFADVFCGSGTLPIEAAMRAKGIAPGLLRNFDFTAWSCAQKGVLERAKQEALDLQKLSAKPNIYAADISKDAISIAKYHAKRANVDDCIRFACADMRHFSTAEKYGVIISNPPYGERLMGETEVKELYAALGKTFFALPDWSGYFLTSFEDFERHFKKRADAKKRLNNANLSCTLFEYYGKKP